MLGFGLCLWQHNVGSQIPPYVCCRTVQRMGSTSPIMPVILGVAAGAMIFIISDEIIPETHRSEHRNLATFSLLTGVVLMLFLDVLLS